MDMNSQYADRKYFLSKYLPPSTCHVLVNYHLWGYIYRSQWQEESETPIIWIMQCILEINTHSSSDACAYLAAVSYRKAWSPNASHSSAWFYHMFLQWRNATVTYNTVLLYILTLRAGLWVGRSGPLPRVLTSRGCQKGGHRPATR
jgi:hypothetical protein